jgi:hypothetical protein
MPVETYNIFTAAFNVPVGQFGFSQAAGNAGQLVWPIRRQYIYFLDRISFSGSIAEPDWLASIDNTTPLPAANATTPAARFYLEKTGQATFSRPFPAINYKDMMELNFWIYSAQANDNLRVNFTGVLNQIPATIGLTFIYAQVSLVMYEITATSAVKRIIEGIDPSFGDFFRKS